MLVLSRKVGEELIIAGHIRVVVISIDRGKVRLGIDAPDNVPVDRAEVHAAKQDWRRDSIHDESETNDPDLSLWKGELSGPTDPKGNHA